MRPSLLSVSIFILCLQIVCGQPVVDFGEQSAELLIAVDDRTIETCENVDNVTSFNTSLLCHIIEEIFELQQENFTIDLVRVADKKVIASSATSDPKQASAICSSEIKPQVDKSINKTIDRSTQVQTISKLKNWTLPSPNIVIWIDLWPIEDTAIGDMAIKSFKTEVDIAVAVCSFDNITSNSSIMIAAGINETRITASSTNATFQTLQLLKQLLSGCPRNSSTMKHISCRYDMSGHCGEYTSYTPPTGASKYCWNGNTSRVACDTKICDFRCQNDTMQRTEACNATCGGTGVARQHNDRAKDEADFLACPWYTIPCTGPPCPTTTAKAITTITTTPTKINVTTTTTSTSTTTTPTRMTTSKRRTTPATKEKVEGTTAGGPMPIWMVVVIAVGGGALVMIIVMSIVIYCVYKKKNGAHSLSSGRRSQAPRSYRGTPRGPPRRSRQGTSRGPPRGHRRGHPRGPPRGSPRGPPRGPHRYLPHGIPHGPPRGTPHGTPRVTSRGGGMGSAHQRVPGHRQPPRHVLPVPPQKPHGLGHGLGHGRVGFGRPKFRRR